VTRRFVIKEKKINFIRYPGGKQRLLGSFLPYLPTRESIEGTFVEPFVGGGSVFFALAPKKALLADINPVLIDLYRGLRAYPKKVWKIFKSFPRTKKGYYKIRDTKERNDLAYRAARTLYLNRTCFKGMWRENSDGEFNVGYGGQDRRWVINQDELSSVARFLRRAKLMTSDFEEVVGACNKGDFLFLDPPYRPGEKELQHDHYVYSKFSYNDHKRLAKSLRRATKRKVRWAMTTSAHKDIVRLFNEFKVIPFVMGTGNRPGLLSRSSGEVLICNY
jgi:DNA adenine methylase